MSPNIKMSSINSDITVHVVLRVKSDEGRTIEEHQRIIQKFGKVLFAKIGKGLGTTFFEQLNYQINKKVPTYFFIAVYEGWNKPFTFIKCNLLNVHSLIRDEELKFVPPYIHPSRNAVSTWFEISEPVRLVTEEVKRLQLATSGREVSSSLRGTTAIFRIVVNGNSPLKTTVLQLKNPKKHDRQIDVDEYEEFADDDTDYIDDFMNSRK